MRRKIQGRNARVSLDEAFNEFIQQKEANGSANDTIRNYNLSYRVFNNFNEFDAQPSVSAIKIVLLIVGLTIYM